MVDIGLKRKTEIDEFTLLQIPLKERINGEAERDGR